jgi:hypothetical protein
MFLFTHKLLLFRPLYFLVAFSRSSIWRLQSANLRIHFRLIVRFLFTFYTDFFSPVAARKYILFQRLIKVMLVLLNESFSREQLIVRFHCICLGEGFLYFLFGDSEFTFTRVWRK